MGGTHIDAVIIKNGKVINTVKESTKPDDLFGSIWGTLQKLLDEYDVSKIKKINLSTTVSTNAIIENKTPPIGMIIQSGPGINHDFLACGEENIFISGYVDHRGRVVKELNSREIKDAIDLFKRKNIKASAIVSKFSTRNPNHELEIKNLMEEDFQTITMGHTISGKLNFPRRVFTSYLNSAVHSSFKDFSDNIKKSLENEGIDAPIFILKADGGTMNLETAEEKPVETILSGPAASFMGLNAMLHTEEDAILLDIGGTTTDIFFLADGVPLFEPLGIEIGSYNTLVRAIYSHSMGLGGDSSISIKNNKLKIGPDRQGHAYAFGGPKATPTDAMIVLGLIENENKEKAYESMEILGNQLDLSPKDVALKILETMGNMIKEKLDELLYKINSHPVYTVKELLHGKQIKPKRINIIGGPAKILAPILEEKFNIPSSYPENYHVANAVGAALAKTTKEITILADTALGKLSVPELGIYENIDSNYTLDCGKKRAEELLIGSVIAMGGEENDIETEIIEASSFNMVDGFYTTGKNIRIQTQVKPGLIDKFGGDNNDKS